MIKNALDLAH